jgi:hypothetical protein
MNLLLWRCSRDAKTSTKVVDQRAKRVAGAEGRSARLRPKAALGVAGERPALVSAVRTCSNPISLRCALGLLRVGAYGGICALLCASAACSGDEVTAPDRTGDASAGCAPVGDATSNIFIDEFSGTECVWRSLIADEGRVPCVIVEATLGTCSCDVAIGRVAPNAAFAKSVQSELRQDGTCDGASGPRCSELCIREVVQLEGDDLAICQNDAGATGPPGFCYVDPAAGLGDPSVVADCSADSQRKLRVLSESDAGAARRFIACIPITFTRDGSAE